MNATTAPGPGGVIANQYVGRVYSNDGFQELLDLFRPEDRLVLDVGCGAGANARRLRERGIRTHGVTVSELEREAAAREMERVVVANIECDDLDYADGHFDALLLSHVLEHLVDPTAALRRLTRLLRPGGRAYVALPNLAYWRQRLLLLAGRFEYTDTGVMDRTHLRFFTYVTAQRLIGEAGLRLVNARAVGHLPLGPLRRVLPAGGQALDRFVSRCCPNLFGFHVLLVGDKS